MIYFTAYIVIAAILCLKEAKRITENHYEARAYFKASGEVRSMPRNVMQDGLYRLGLKFPYFVWMAIGLFSPLWLMFLVAIATQDFISKKAPARHKELVYLLQVVFYTVLYIAINKGWLIIPIQLETWY